MDNFAKAGGTIYVCSPCFKKRKLDENNLVAGAAIVGGAKLVEFLSDGCPCVSYWRCRWSPLTATRTTPTPASTAATSTAATGSCC